MEAILPSTLVEDWMGSLIPDSLIATSADGIIVQWNEGASALYGYSTDEALGKELDDFLATRHPFGTTYLQEKLDRTGRWQGEVFRRTAEGQSLGIRVHRLQLPAAGLTSIGTVEWSRPLSDVTPEEIASHRYTNLFNAMAASFWELDFGLVRKALGELVASGVSDVPQFLLTHPDWIDEVIPFVRVLDVNEKTLELFAIPDKQTALDHPMDWAWPAESRTVFARSLIAALHRDDRFTIETVLSDREGNAIDVLFTVCWPSEHKAQGSVLVGVIDLSETKQAFRALQESEQHYRDLFQSMPLPLLRVDLSSLNDWIERLPDLSEPELADYIESHPQFVTEINQQPRIVGANPEALKLFEVSSIEDLKGPIDWAWRDRPGTLHRSLIARLRGAAEFSEETRISRPDGTSVDVLYVISFAQDRVDRGYNVVGLVDITDRRAAEEELRVAREELSHAARISMLGELTASIAHEVNQPLAAISALADASLRWLDRPAPDFAEVRMLAGDIASDARRASEIISRIRAMATKRQGAVETLDLNALVEESLLILRHDCEARDVSLVLRLAPGLPMVTADRIQLQQVIVNFVVNAMQAMAMQSGQPRYVFVETNHASDDTVRLAVEDTGPGIEPENLVKLFDSFFTTKGSGMGLGLSVCKSIVEAHGGTIAASNTERGARFEISLPQE
jgi:PAS domain S-box-containing protein